MVVVKDDEALHLDAAYQQSAHQSRQIVRSLRFVGGVIVGDQAAYRYPGVQVQQGQYGAEYGAADFPQQLAAACDKGIDVYFENVGGAVFSAVLPLLNLHARVPVCGLIANYNATDKPQGPDNLPGLMGRLLVRRIKMQGFIIFDYYHRYPEFFKEMSGWFAAGKIKFREDIVDGLENAPQAFIGLLEGKNFGKLVIRAGDE